MDEMYICNITMSINYCFLDGFFKNLSFQKGMSERAGGWELSEHRATSEVYLLINLFEKPVHNAIRHFSCC